MPTQKIEQEMVLYFMQLNTAEKKSVLQMIKTFLKGKKNKPGRITLDQYNKEIDQAMKRMDAGEFYTHEEEPKKYCQLFFHRHWFIIFPTPQMHTGVCSVGRPFV